MSELTGQLLISAWPILALMVFLVVIFIWVGRKNRPFVDMQQRQLELREKLVEQNERMIRALERIADRDSGRE